MLKQALVLKKFFSWKNLLANASAMKKARGPLRGYVTTLAWWALLETGLWNALIQSPAVSLQTFAQKYLLNHNLLSNLCLYLSRQGFLQKKGEEVSLTRKGKAFAQNTRGVFTLFHAYEPFFSSLMAQLKGEKSFGKELLRNEAEVAQGFRELGKSFLFPLMEGILLENGFSRVVELGCGQVDLSSYLCARHQGWQCVGIDHDPVVLDKAQKELSQISWGKNIQLLNADIFDLMPGQYDFSTFEVVAAIDLFHGYFWDGPEKLLQLFRNLKKVFHRQKFLISEINLPPESGMARIAYPFPEHELFHALTQQRSFSPGQLEKLTQEAGFQIKKSYSFNKIAGRVCLLLG